jgi:hypothetical protein
MQRATVAVEFAVGEAVAVFCPLEQWQKVGKAPAGVALCRPTVVVLAVAAGVDLRVDRAGAAQDFAARLEALAASQSFLRCGEVMPAVHQAKGQHDGKTQRCPHEHRMVRSTRFQHADGRVGVFCQARSQCAPGRTTADDDVVKLLHIGPFLFGQEVQVFGGEFAIGWP